MYSIELLKYIRNIVAPVLASIVSKSLSTGEFPDSLKVARVVPIPKPGDPTKISNYRPISILPTLSKIFERVVYKQLYSYLEVNDILFSDQYGFRAGRSTSHAILNQLQFVYSNLDNGNLVLSIFLDFRKAFDSVNHDILLSKLNFYGVRGLAHSWFCSYLDNRMQYTAVGDARSPLEKIRFGVPQGSLLGPLLFLVFINDLPNCSDKFKFVLFADDSALSVVIPPKNINNEIVNVNCELKRVNRWLRCSKICLNADKTKFMLFSYRKEFMLPGIFIDDCLIEECDALKYLGIYLDAHLSFKQHVRYISAKISKSLGILYRLNRFLDSRILIMLYATMIKPYISYAVESWFSSYHNVSDKIVVLQKKACRAVFSLPYNSHTAEYFKLMRCQRVDDIFRYTIAVLAFKTLYLNQCSFLFDMLDNNTFTHSHLTRSDSSFVIPLYRKTKSQFCIHYQLVKIWNSLPLEIRSAKSIFIFKKLIRQYLDSEDSTP